MSQRCIGFGEDDHRCQRAMVARLEYGAWGEELFVSAIPALADFPYRFVGSLGVRTDEETGLVYMRARHYDKQLQRFISRDPIGFIGGADLYAYVKNPMNEIDPFGLTSGPVLTPEVGHYTRYPLFWGPNFQESGTESLESRVRTHEPAPAFGEIPGGKSVIITKFKEFKNQSADSGMYKFGTNSLNMLSIYRLYGVTCRCPIGSRPAGSYLEEISHSTYLLGEVNNPSGGYFGTPTLKYFRARCKCVDECGVISEGEPVVTQLDWYQLPAGIMDYEIL